jgi:hypothetical protein
MADPIMMSIATTLASKATDAVLDAGKSAWAALLRLVRGRFSTDGAASAALNRAQAAPDDSGRVQELALALERIVAVDADFGSRLHEWWAQFRPDLWAGDGGVVNSNTGTVAGHLIQARDIQARDLHVGESLMLGDAPRRD